jgi:hypothetical protein
VRVVEINNFYQYLDPFFTVYSENIEQLNLHLVYTYELALIETQVLVLFIILNYVYQVLVKIDVIYEQLFFY